MDMNIIPEKRLMMSVMIQFIRDYYDISRKKAVNPPDIYLRNSQLESMRFFVKNHMGTFDMWAHAMDTTMEELEEKLTKKMIAIDDGEKLRLYVPTFGKV